MVYLITSADNNSSDNNARSQPTWPGARVYGPVHPMEAPLMDVTSEEGEDDEVNWSGGFGLVSLFSETHIELHKLEPPPAEHEENMLLCERDIQRQIQVIGGTEIIDPRDGPIIEHTVWLLYGELLSILYDLEDLRNDVQELFGEAPGFLWSLLENYLKKALRMAHRFGDLCSRLLRALRRSTYELNVPGFIVGLSGVEAVFLEAVAFHDDFTYWNIFPGLLDGIEDEDED